MIKLSSVSFFCPAYNDEENLPKLIPKVYSFLSDITNDFEIIIVEDYSPDRTAEVADRLAREFTNTRVIHHEKNRGYGGALKSGFLASKYDYVMYTDGDNQYDITEFKPYLTLLDGNDILSGYAVGKAVSLFRKIQSRFYNFLIETLFSTNIRDIHCSMKIYKKKVLQNLKIISSSAFIDAEMLIKAKRKGYKIAQFPVTHFKREAGMASGSKPSVILGTIKDMLKFRFGML